MGKRKNKTPVKQEKPVTDKKASAPSVADLFARKKKRPASPAPEGEQTSDEAVAAIMEKEAEIAKIADDKPRRKFNPALNPTLDEDAEALFADTRGSKRVRRQYTEEGDPIYTPAELKMGQGGGTPYCPFDCDCCF